MSVSLPCPVLLNPSPEEATKKQKRKRHVNFNSIIPLAVTPHQQVNSPERKRSRSAGIEDSIVQESLSNGCCHPPDLDQAVARPQNFDNEIVNNSRKAKVKVAIKEEVELLNNPSPHMEGFIGNVSSQENRESSAGDGEKDTEEWRGLYSKLDCNRKIRENDFSMMRNLPPLQPNELEWVIEDFLQFRDPDAEARLYSPAKNYNSITFRLFVDPRSNETPKPELGDVSIFLAVDPGDCFPCDADQWNMQKSDYQFIALSWKNWRENSIIERHSFAFCAAHKNQGRRKFIQKERLVPGELLGPDGQLVLRAQLCPKPAEVNIKTNNHREFGYLGIRKQAEAGYLNSLVQSLFHIGKFRESVFKLTVDEDENFIDGVESIVGLLPPRRSTNADEKDAISEERKRVNATASALQSVFLHLHWANGIANTDGLLKSFGLDLIESLTQHNAQELQVLFPGLKELETLLDGAKERQLFGGEMNRYIECVNVEYVSSRKVQFYCLSINVKGNQNLLQWLRKYTAEQMLEEDNAYNTREYGKQPARKGVRFLRFPPVLQFHLNRLTRDLSRKNSIKLNQYFGYPEILDLDEFLPGSGKYKLFCVIVHADDVVGKHGHYYVINRPGGRRFWLKFDDEKVSLVSPNAALSDCFGGHDKVCYDYTASPDGSSRGSQKGNLSHPPVKPHSAYMLFYVKCDLASEILAEPIPEEDNA